MKKRILVTTLALTLAAGVAATPLQAAAAGKVQIIGGKIDGNFCGGNWGSVAGLESLKEFLENCELPGITLPEQPDAPQGPETPEQPEAPETPEVPEKPEVPEIPETPEKPEVPEKPIQPEKPEVLTLEEQVVELVNKERAKAGLKPVEIQKNVADAAAVRAKEIKTSFSHTRPNGTSCFTALKEQGVNYRSAGENIAWGQKSPEEVMNAWMNSDGHRANILNEKFTKIGIGHFKDSNGRNYWAQMFVS